LALEIFRWKAMARLHTQITPNGRKCEMRIDASDARNAKSEKYYEVLIHAQICTSIKRLVQTNSSGRQNAGAEI